MTATSAMRRIGKPLARVPMWFVAGRVQSSTTLDPIGSEDVLIISLSFNFLMIIKFSDGNFYLF